MNRPTSPLILSRYLIILFLLRYLCHLYLILVHKLVHRYKVKINREVEDALGHRSTSLVLHSYRSG